MKKITLSCIIATFLIQPVFAQTEQTDKLQIHGTIRGKYEYQTELKENRFQVRNARVSFSGKVTPKAAYMAEIDLSEEGQIKMLDAYARIIPTPDFNITIGQMRVPFTIDAHRNPQMQYFPNRSFIAKQVGSVRDVGASVSYKHQGSFPFILEGGLFNGSGITNYHDFWRKGINFSTKAQLFFPQGFNLTLSTQKIKPDKVNIMMYDAGTYFEKNGWHIEAEYLFKKYHHKAYDDVHAVNVFGTYAFPLNNSFVTRISPLIRYDFMTDHSNGITDDSGKLFTTDYERSRVTGGVTLGLGLPFQSDLRINYEKYFYRSGGVAKPSEMDKFVTELMIHF